MPKPTSTQQRRAKQATGDAAPPAPDGSPPARRPRGRPPKDPTAGPASAAKRAAALREREKREIRSLITTLGEALDVLEGWGHHSSVTFLFRADRRQTLAALRRHWPEKAAAIEEQRATCQILTNELRGRVARSFPEGRAKGSIIFDGKEWAMTAAGIVTCDGVPTEYRVVRRPGAHVVVYGMGGPDPAHRTHDSLFQHTMALYDVALLMTERGTGPGRVKLLRGSTSKTPIPDAGSYKPASGEEVGGA